MRLRHKILRFLIGEDLYDISVKLRTRGISSIRNYAFDPVTATVITMGAIAAGGAVYQAKEQSKAAKKATSASEDAMARQAAAAKELQDKMAAGEASAAAQAAQQIEQRKRRVLSGSKSIYSSPLGLAGTANVARKTLLGE